MGCDGSKFTKTPENQFIGNWKLVDRGMFENIEITISKNEKGEFSGVIKKINDNKFVNLFMEVGDQFLTNIKRHSNFEFQITEKKIAAPLFAAYGQSTNAEFTVTFENKNTILLGNQGGDGKYIRIK